MCSSDLAETEISCKICGQVLVERRSIRRWKDLPSEGWAEMMEFWHCHKPNEPHDHEDQNASKGYAANNSVALEAGVGLVDTMNFMLAGVDCKHIQVGPRFPQCFSPCKFQESYKMLSSSIWAIKRTGPFRP